MSERKRNAPSTKARILAAARRLFAERDISAVSIRDIAREADVSHGLVQQYFGTREHMIAAIIQSEIEDFFARFSPARPDGVHSTLEDVRNQLKTGRTSFRDFAVLITRAQLAGVKPETMLNLATPTPATALAATIRDQQTHAPADPDKMDPLLVSAYVNATIFAFETIYPWLMASVGLKPEDYEARQDEIIDISMKLITLAIGANSQKEG
jgi:AcrR family transcriptional regulator